MHIIATIGHEMAVQQKFVLKRPKGLSAPSKREEREKSIATIENGGFGAEQAAMPIGQLCLLTVPYGPMVFGKSDC